MLDSGRKIFNFLLIGDDGKLSDRYLLESSGQNAVYGVWRYAEFTDNGFFSHSLAGLCVVPASSSVTQSMCCLAFSRLNVCRLSLATEQAKLIGSTHAIMSSFAATASSKAYFCLWSVTILALLTSTSYLWQRHIRHSSRFFSLRGV